VSKDGEEWQHRKRREIETAELYFVFIDFKEGSEIDERPQK